MPRLMSASLLALSLAVAAPAVAQDGALTEAQKEAVRDLVRETLVDNPDILREAFAALQAREQAAAVDRQREALFANAAELYDSERDPVLGNPKGDVTLVEFFDYRCGYCKSVLDTVLNVVESDGNVRFVLKEFPILGADSVLAAQYALAAREQGKYEPFHLAMMRHRGAFTEATIKKIAKDAGLDVARLEKDADSDAIKQELLDNRRLAEALGINGTPAFAVGDTLLPGAVDADTLKGVIAEARAEKKS